MDAELMNDRCCLTCKQSFSEERITEDGDLLWCNRRLDYVAEDDLCGEFNY